MRAQLTPQAEIDLEEIGDYIALDNPKRAARDTFSPSPWGSPSGNNLACAAYSADLHRLL